MNAVAEEQEDTRAVAGHETWWYDTLTDEVHWSQAAQERLGVPAVTDLDAAYALVDEEGANHITCAIAAAISGETYTYTTALAGHPIRVTVRRDEHRLVGTSMFLRTEEDRVERRQRLERVGVDHDTMIVGCPCGLWTLAIPLDMPSDEITAALWKHHDECVVMQGLRILSE